MTQEALQIKRHSIMPRWDKSQMEAGAVRIHARFQALITSVIESADWANYRLTKDPLEVGRPAWPSPGKFCDLVIARRSGHVEGALEIKTRSDAVGVSPIDKMHSTLDMMGTDLYELQRAAHQADALWVVALGIYRVPFQAMAISWDAEWSDIVLAWGRDVGRDSPMSMMRWSSFASLDNAMCYHKDLKSFFSVASLPRKLPNISFNPPAPEPQQEVCADELHQAIDESNLAPSAKLAIKVISEWGDHVAPVKTRCREYVTEEISESALQHQIISLVEAGVCLGYKKGSRRHRLHLNSRALMNMLKED